MIWLPVLIGHLCLSGVCGWVWLGEWMSKGCGFKRDWITCSIDENYYGFNNELDLEGHV